MGVVDRATIDARRRTGFETTDRELKFAQPGAEGLRRRIASPTASMLRKTDMDFPGEECPGGKHDGARFEADTHLGDDTDGSVAFNNQVVGRLLE